MSSYPQGTPFTWRGSLNFTAWFPSKNLTHHVDSTIFSHFPSASLAPVREKCTIYWMEKSNTHFPSVIWPLPLSRMTSLLPSALLNFTHSSRHSQDLLPPQSPFLMIPACRHVTFFWTPTALTYSGKILTTLLFLVSCFLLVFFQSDKSGFMSCPSNHINKIELRALWHLQILTLVQGFQSDILETWRKDSLAKAWELQVPAIGNVLVGWWVEVERSFLDWPIRIHNYLKA